MIGRDKSQWWLPNQRRGACDLTSVSQMVIDDPFISNKHLRIYTVVYDVDKPTEVAPLVYAEDLSRNGTFWNGTFIGKGNGGFLLSDGDNLRLSARTIFVFRRLIADESHEPFDLTQEREMKVGRVIFNPRCSLTASRPLEKSTS